MTSRTWAIAMAAALLLLAGCGDSDAANSPSTSAASDAASRIHGSWFPTTAVVGEDTTTPPPGAVVSVDFGADGRIAGHAGCNTFSSRYRAEEDGAFSADPASITEKGCVDITDWFELLDALASATAFQLADDESRLTLTDAEGRTVVELTSFAPDGAAS